jgi:transcriptional regulator with XRE-family HTH domain
MSKLLTPQEIETQASERGWSVVNLCERAGIAPSTFYRWLLGQSEPKLGIYQRLVGALETEEQS